MFVGGDVMNRVSEPRRLHSKNQVTWSDCVVKASRDSFVESSSLGIRFRGAVPGPEQVLVESFLAETKMSLGRERSLTVFAQPAIDTGFPDLVAVVWRSEIARRWSPERERLRATDLRLLHLLATNGALDILFLREVFQRGLHSMLTRLEEAGVVSVEKSECRARNLSQIFAVQRIIAIEAKVSATQRALEQAGANIWFSSESHVLLPRAQAGERIKDLASALGVGMIGFENDNWEQVYKASIRPVPLSYGSWLFNEWAWRIARAQGEI